MNIANRLRQVSEAPNDMKVDMLRQVYHPGLLVILRYGLDKNVKWLLPKGKPPYKPWSEGEAETVLMGKAKKLYLFTTGPGIQLSTLLPDPNDDERRKKMKQMKLEKLFVELIESLDPEDAELVLAIKDGEFPYKITPEQAREAYPGLF